MFFVLSKLLNYLAQPFLIVCAIFIASAFIKRPTLKKWFFRTGLVLLLFFSNDFIINEIMSVWEVKPIAFNAITKQYEYGIILTGVTKSQMVPNDRVYFNRGADRVTHSVQLYKLGIIKKIVVSGGSGRLINIGEREADDVAKALVLMGVPSEAIEIENQSKNTHESAIAVKNILTQKKTQGNYILITSGFHMRRSVACFKKEGINVDMFSCDFLTHKREFTLDVLLIPRAEAFSGWSTLIKEWIGLTAYWVSGYV